ncbi:MAG: hypothetical protein KDE19_22845 [Caldilineaceae bacterium]|nr:hypothetical protein [Caldilineaceae bacterium]
MSKLRLTFFGSRSAPAPQQLPPGQAGAPQNQPPQRFQLQTAQQRQPTLDWEWGEETQKLFQLQKTTTASTRELVSTHHKPTSVSSNTQHAADFERWRRPQMPTANEPTAAITETSPLVGEILPASTEPESLWAKPPQDRAQSVATMPPQPTTLHSNSSSYRRNGTVHSATNSALLQPFLGEEGMRRVLATRIALDEALDRWWTNGEHAPLALLRDGLLTLEAGHELDETQRSFLLRTALRAGRGIVTALQYQMDADRTAFLLKEALLDTKLPFDPALIGYLRQHDEQSAEWADYLEHDLAYEATVASGKRSQLAATALRMMQAQQTSAPSSEPNNTLTASPVTRPATQPKRAGVQHPIRRFTAATLKPWPMPTKTMPEPMLRPLSHRWSLRWLFWAVLVLFVALRLGWPQLISSAPMVEIPAGTYRISD